MSTARIEEIRSEGEAAVSGASTTAELEELRVRYLGRKAELPQLLRGVAELPPEERGQVGKAANEARRALEELIAARAQELDAAEIDTRLARLVGRLADRAALLGRELGDAAQQVGQLGLAPEEAHAQLLQRRRIAGTADGRLGLGAQLVDAVQRAHAAGTLESS